MTLDFHDLGIIADDLTGACDIAACFAPTIGPVSVAVSLDLASGNREDVDVTNTQSRLVDGNVARDLLFGVGRTLSSKSFIFKKIDAGLRGPVGAELAGLLAGLEASGKEWRCVVAPAIPSIGRITRGGIQYEDGVPIHQSALSQDPHSPPASADIRQIIRNTGGGDYCVADAESADDLERIVACHLTYQHIVFAGSLGLARALAQKVRGASRSVVSAPPAERPMLVCGSRHPLAVRQMELAERAGNQAVGFNPFSRVFESPKRGGGHTPLLLGIKADTAAGSDQPAGSLLSAFVEGTAEFRDKLHVDGLAVIGGETAYELLRRLGARRLDVLRSHAEVIADSRINGGSMDGCRFISKGGSVGSEDAARRMLALLTS